MSIRHHILRSFRRFPAVMVWLSGMLMFRPTCDAASGSAAIVRNGQSTSAIVVSADAAPDETFAAEELREHLRLMCDVEIPLEKPNDSDAVAALRNQGLCPILLGEAAMDDDLRNRIRARGADPASFALVVNQQGIRVAGLSPEGTLFGVYELLEQVGVRWFTPGDFGRVAPRQSTVILPHQITIQVPSFAGRHIAPLKPRGAKWVRRMRMGGPFFPGSHGVPPFRGRRVLGELFEQHPEYFAELDGDRVRRQLCVSNPEVSRLAIGATKEFFRKRPDMPWMGIGPNDGGGFCQCEHCRALDAGDWDPFNNEVSVTDRYLWFFHQVLDGIADEFPEKRLCFYAYHSYKRPPLKTEPDPRIVPALAPISLCRIHGMSNPICPEKGNYAQLMKQWTAICPEVYERSYIYNLADPGFPFSLVHRMRDEVPMAKRFGLAGWRIQPMSHWGSMTPTFYIAAKLFWNADADVDALLADFTTSFFGPAAAPMRRYLDRMDAVLRDRDYHTGASFDLPHFYTDEVMAAGRRDLDRAASLGKDAPYAGRVAAFRVTFDYLDAFLEMLKQRNRFDFVAAKQSLDRLVAIQEQAFAHEPPLLEERFARSYLKRFWSPCTIQGCARTTGGNRIAAGLPDEWEFLIDPQKVGTMLGYWRADLKGGNWQRIRTKTSSWSNQGLRYYKGDAWYRARVSIPAGFANRPIRLWFGGVDEKARVWVNGKPVRLLTETRRTEIVPGDSPGSAFNPFEYDVTAAVACGDTNLVVVRVTNEQVNEIGTGGITAPVMFYVPAANEDNGN